MTLQYYIGGKIVGLEADTKPLNVPENTTFIESDTFKEFIFVSGIWQQLSGTPTPIVATGGTITQVGSNKVHTFDASGTFEITSGSGNLAYLVVAGGGGGASRFWGGGGGAGGYQEDSFTRGVASFTVTVGAGGSRQTTVGLDGNDGNDSVFDTVTSTAGGGGGTNGAGGHDGGSGGGSGGGGGGLEGGSGNTPPTEPSQGGDGGDTANPTGTGSAGGGGGASQAGAQPVSNIGGDGGDGRESTIDGLNLFRAGGGGGGGNAGAGAGGNGGGGAGGTVNGTDATVANSGSGGGGAGNPGEGGAGADGVVIVSYFSPSTGISLTELKAYYKMNEASGTIENSANGTGSPDAILNAELTLAGGTSHGATGLYDNGVNYNGVNGSTSALSSTLADWAFLNRSGEKWTLALWVKMNSFTQTGMVLHTTNFNGGDTGCFIRIQTDRKVAIDTGHSGVDAFSYTSTATLDNDFVNWQFVVVTYDDGSGDLKVHINNNGGETSGGHNLTNNNNPEQVLRIGNNSDGVFDLDAVIDEYSIWNRVLNADEITALYNGGLGLQL